MHIQDKYLDYCIYDFVWDEQFRATIEKLPLDSSAFDRLIERYPQKKQEIESARDLIIAMRVKEEYFSTNEIDQVIADTRSIIVEENLGKGYDRKLFVRSDSKRLSYTYYAAASLIFILGTILWFLIKPQQESQKLSVKSYQLLKKGSTQMIEKINQQQVPLMVSLPDGSSVLLSKQSVISYDNKFLALNDRVVYLSGEAVFDIKRNPQKPFYVYANGLVTKVLGTKFKVRSYEGDKEATVEVASGKVSVFASNDLNINAPKAREPLSSFVLSPNQKVTYTKSNESFVKTLIDVPIILNPESVERELFDFDNTALKVVFARLQKAYGIEIVFDEILLGNCSLKANLEGFSLYEQLSLICKVMNGDYEVIDGKVIISAKGCIAQ
jgi:preprotein translocase subunit YajC